MAQIGKINRLKIMRVLDFGAHLDGGESGDFLLAKKEIPPGSQLGDEVEVFIFIDKENRKRATTQKPLATVGQFAKLQVVSSSPSGAYLDWGLKKDLLVPKSEQQARMELGKSYVVYVFLDEKTNRIAASTKLDRFLSRKPPAYLNGEEVEIIICGKTDLGYKAIVNDSHWGVIYKNEVFQKVHIGQRLKGYIKNIRLDLKIDLSLQPAGYQQVGDVSQAIFDKIKKFGGMIPVTDKSKPEDIYDLFGVSKKVFKKAIGALYKRRLISIDAKGIKLTKK